MLRNILRIGRFKKGKSAAMKTKMILTAATLSVLCVFYSSRSVNTIETNGASTETPAANLPLAPLNSGSVKVPTTLESPEPDVFQSTYNRFVVNTNRQSEVVGRKGTKLVFPAFAFEDENGETVDGNVEIVMKECYDLNEILAEKLSTTSGERIIETAGMVHIEARQSNRTLRLKDDSRYTVFFPTRGKPGKEFELFYGSLNSRGIIDWTAAASFSEEEATTVRSTSPVAVRSDCFIQICESEFRRRTRISEMDYFNWQLQDGQSLNQWFVSNFNPDASMVDDFCANKLISRIAFHVHPDGSFKDYYIAHESKPEYDRVIADFLSTMPSLDLNGVMPEYSSDHLCVLAFGRQQGSAGDEFVKRFRKRYDTKSDTLPMAEVVASDLDYYMFSSTELGWLNCDRFVTEETPLVEFRVKARTSPGASVSMVFEARKSIVRGVLLGDEFVFASVPSGEKVRLLAVDNNGGKPVMQQVLTTTSAEAFHMNTYEPMTLAKLDAAMCWK